MVKENRKKKKERKMGKRKGKRGRQSECALAAIAGCAGQGRRARHGARARGGSGAWNRRMESGVGNLVFGTEKRFSGVRVQVLGGFELNDENNFKKKIF